MRRGLAALAALAAAGLIAAGCGSEGIPEAGNTSRGKAALHRRGPVRQLPHARRRRHEGTGRARPRRRVRRSRAGTASARRRSPSVVRNQIAYPVTDPTTGAPGMPANLVTGQDADDVALYVASVAGKAVPPPTGGPPSAGATTGGTTTGGGGGKQSGATIFASAGCGSCHTLAARGHERHDRPEPRRGEAVEGARGRARHERRARRCPPSRASSARRRSRPSPTTCRRRRKVARSRTTRRQASRPSLPPRPPDRPPRAVIGTPKRARAPVTTPRSSQFERPSGWVEITISSGRRCAPRRPWPATDRRPRSRRAPRCRPPRAGRACDRAAAARPLGHCPRPRPRS